LTHFDSEFTPCLATSSLHLIILDIEKIPCAGGGVQQMSHHPSCVDIQKFWWEESVLAICGNNSILHAGTSSVTLSLLKYNQKSKLTEAKDVAENLLQK